MTTTTIQRPAPLFPTLRGVVVGIAVVLLAAGCSSQPDTAAGAAEETSATVTTVGSADQGQSGEPVPAFTLFTPAEDRSPQNFKSAPLIAKTWRELGLEVEVEAVELFELFGQVFREHEFEVALYQWTPRADRLDPFPYLGFAAPGSDYDGSGWQNDQYLELLDLQASQFDPGERQETVFQLQEILSEELPMTVTFYADDVLAYDSTRFEDLVAMPGEGLYNEWSLLRARPLTDDRVLTIGDAGEPESINPYSATSATAWSLLRLYYDRLVRLSPTLEGEPSAAESLEWLDDTTLEVTLKEGMEFHDGEAVTAEDVVFSYQSLIDHEVEYFQSFLAPLGSVEAEGDSTVRFEFTEPFSPFVNVTMPQVPILPSHLWEDMDNPTELDPSAVPTVGSGPFVLEQFDRGEYIRLSPHTGHFDPPIVDAVEFVLFADTEGVFTALQVGEIDMHTRALQSGQIDLAQGEDHLSLATVPGIGYNFVVWNVRGEPFEDHALRRAMSHAIDREGLVETVVDGRGDAGSSVISPGNVAWHNPEVATDDFDLEGAREILTEAGYGWDEDGRLLAPPK